MGRLKRTQNITHYQDDQLEFYSIQKSKYTYEDNPKDEFILINDFEIQNLPPIEDDNRSYVVVKKCPFDQTLRDSINHPLILDAINRVNNIVFHTCNFLKLYFIHLYDHNQIFPSNKEELKKLVDSIIKTITFNSDNRGRKGNNTLIDDLKPFFEEHYQTLLGDAHLIDRTKLDFNLEYERKDIVKNIINNISLHYSQYLRRFVNYFFDVNAKINRIKKSKLKDSIKKKKYKKINETYDKVKNDFFNPNAKNENTFESDKEFHSFILRYKNKVVPLKNSYEKDSICYDVKVHPLDYLKSMIYMNKTIGKINKMIDEINNIEDALREKNNLTSKKINPYKLFHPLPLRSSIIPKYVTFDTASLISLLDVENKMEKLQDIKIFKKAIWDDFLRTNNKIFKRNGYKFNYSIKTDGVGCSIIFAKVDQYGRVIESPFFKNDEEDDLDVELRDGFDNPYIEDIKITDEMKDKLFVYIDPGHTDLINCMSENRNFDNEELIEYTDTKFIYEETVTPGKYENGEWKRGKIDRELIDEKLYNVKIKPKETINFRYTRAQRKKETKSKKYKMIRESIGRKEKINEKSVKEIESELSSYNSKICNFEEFKKYLKKKIEINRLLGEHYDKYIYRKLRLNTYTNSTRSEDMMLNNFQKKYGKPDDVIIIFGDYDKKETNKFSQPALMKRIRKLMRKRGYTIYMINEYKTSKICSKCHKGENKNFIKTIQKKEPHKKRLVWKLIKCKNTNCKSIHNRDANAVRNMEFIVNKLKEGKKRPKIFRRKNELL